jgi:hypothetical protein
MVDCGIDRGCAQGRREGIKGVIVALGALNAGPGTRD